MQRGGTASAAASIPTPQLPTSAVARWVGRRHSTARFENRAPPAAYTPMPPCWPPIRRESRVGLMAFLNPAFQCSRPWAALAPCPLCCGRNTSRGKLAKFFAAPRNLQPICPCRHPPPTPMPLFFLKGHGNGGKRRKVKAAVVSCGPHQPNPNLPTN